MAKNGGHKGNLSVTFNTYSETQGKGEPAYRREFRSKDDRWKARNKKPIQAAIFGISTGSDYATTEDKLDRGLQAILQQVDHLYISNTYGPYQHVFIQQEGMSTEAAMDKAFLCASDWLTQNTPIIFHYRAEARKLNKTVKVIDWIDEIRENPNFTDHLTEVHRFFNSCDEFRDAIRDDTAALKGRIKKRLIENGEIDPENIPAHLEDTAISIFDPYIGSALEKIAGYWLMADALKEKTGCDEIAYFHNGPVSPQIDFFRTRPDLVPETMQSLTSLVYVDISFKSRKTDVTEQQEISFDKPRGPQVK